MQYFGEKPSLLMASLLAITLMLSVFSSAFAYSAGLNQPVLEKMNVQQAATAVAATLDDDEDEEDDDDNKGKGKGKNKKNSDDDDKKGKGKKNNKKAGEGKIKIVKNSDDDCISDTINNNLDISGEVVTFFDCNINGNLKIDDSQVRFTNSKIDGNIDSDDSRLSILATEINGNVQADGGSIKLLDTTINGNLHCDDVTEFSIQGSTISGNIEGCQSDDKDHDDDKKGKRDDQHSPPQQVSGDFKLVADGVAIIREGGADKTATDAELKLVATAMRTEGNHVRVSVKGNVTLGTGEDFAIENGRGVFTFFKSRGATSVQGTIHITGKAINEGDGDDSGKFGLRALLLAPADGKSGTWKVIVEPAAKVGPHIRLLGVEGTLTKLDGTPLPPPPAPALSHFVVSTIPQRVTAGALFEVTATAHKADGTLLKSYEGIASITDLTGTVKPTVTPKFKEGKFKGSLNITKAISSNNVTFTDQATGKKGTGNKFAVTVGPLASIDLSPSQAKLAPGGEAQFTARGFDRFSNELSGLSFSWSLSSPEFGSIATSSTKANFTASSTMASSANVTLTASIGSLSDSSKISIVISPPPQLDRFVIGPIASLKTAGMLFAINVTAVDSGGNPVTAYSGPMRLTDTTGTLNMTVSSGFVNGKWTGNVNITKAATGVRITAKDVASPLKQGTSNEFEVVAGALHRFVIGNVANQTAGAEFNIVVTAKDAFGNTKKNFLGGNVTLTSTDGPSPKGNLTTFTPNPYNFTAADAGEHMFAVKMYNAKKDVTITTTGSGKTGTSNKFNLNPAAPAKVTVSPTGATVSPGGEVTFTAKAFDAFGNEIIGASFTWTLSSSALGTLDGSTSSSTKFTAGGSSTSGTITATSGSAGGNASITVS